MKAPGTSLWGGKEVIDRRVPQPRQPSDSNADQASSNADQASSNADQASSSADQAASEADQRASDREQAAADRELAAIASPTAGQLRAHEQAKAARLEATMARVAAAALRSQSATGRDGQGQGRDASAHQRDQTSASHGKKVDVARDRAAVGRDRAAVDRDFAARDRELHTVEIGQALMDEPSGAYGRQLGEVILGHEIARTKNTKGTLVLGVIRIDEGGGLPDGDPTHPGPDRHFFLALQARLRPFDAIVSWGEQEFVCVLFGEAEEDARQRIEQACADLVRQHPGVAIGIGLAALKSEDTLYGLVERARPDC